MLRDSRVRAVVWVLIGVLVAAIVAFVMASVALTAQIRQTQVDRAAKADNSYATLKIIKGCTDPRGKCYRQGQKRTAQAVSRIAANEVVITACALQVPRGTPLRTALHEVQACVEHNQGVK